LHPDPCLYRPDFATVRPDEEGCSTMGTIAVQGHRGSPDPRAGITENTLPSFMRARELGADGVEVDVRMTADGALAVHHDPVVPGVGTVAELAASALPPSVPLLAAALDVCTGMVVNIEIKDLPGEPGFDPDSRIADAVVDLVRGAGRASTVVISCFWPATLETVRRADPDLATGLLLAPWFDPDQAVATALDHGCTAIHPHVDLVGAALVDRAHRADLDVATWTVNDRAALLSVAEAGVDTVISDDVALATATLGHPRPPRTTRGS
jgi:glycerophosphoryl diester phosphodiesterase